MDSNGRNISVRLVCTVASAAFVLAFSGCGIFRSAADPLVGSGYAPLARDAAAKTFTPPPGKAAIYLYETRLFGNWLAGMRDPCIVGIDGKIYGDFGWNGYVYSVVDAGEHDVHVDGFIDPDYLFWRNKGPIIEDQFVPATLTVVTTAGQSLFIEHKWEMHRFTQVESRLLVVDPQAGMAAISRKRLLGDYPGLPLSLPTSPRSPLGPF